MNLSQQGGNFNNSTHFYSFYNIDVDGSGSICFLIVILSADGLGFSLVNVILSTGTFNSGISPRIRVL